MTKGFACERRVVGCYVWGSDGSVLTVRLAGVENLRLGALVLYWYRKPP
jgi:hypothetical protein